MTSVLFSGCSFVQGCGLENEHENPEHFSNILATNLFGIDHAIENIGVVGHSNDRIFLDTAVNLTKNHYDYAFVCWTALHRYVFWLGLELYESKRSFLPSKRFTRVDMIEEHNGNNISWTAEKLTKLNDDFLLLNHPHYYIRDLIGYVNVLIKLAESQGTKIFFINNILPWDKNYFVHIDKKVIPSMLTEYTNELLNSSNRNDQEINQLYHLMHGHYANQGGINSSHWLNLYSSFFDMMIDIGSDGLHPGIKSQRLFAECLTKEFNSH
jgi:hypothetical protein